MIYIYNINTGIVIILLIILHVEPMIVFFLCKNFDFNSVGLKTTSGR
jgi:hypothetical protein